MKVMLLNDDNELLDVFWLHSGIHPDNPALASSDVREHISDRYDTFDIEDEYHLFRGRGK